MHMKKIAIVTGGTSGIGLATAQALHAKGVHVYALSRHPLEGCDIPHIACDVSDPAAVQGAVDEVLRREGRIDILVNCAGFGISGAFEFTNPDDARRLMEVNVYGMSHAIQAVLPAMRAQKSGRIVNISSVAAVAPIPFQAWYSISKAAVNALTLAVANEVRPFGITVCAAMPGDIRTGFTAARKKSPQGDDVYGGRIQRSVSKMEKDELGGMSADFAGRKIAALALNSHTKPYVALGGFYKGCTMLTKILPVRMIRWLLEKLYAR